MTGTLKVLILPLQQYKKYIAIRLGAGHVVRKEKYTKQSPATNISHQEKGRKIQEKMGRWSDRRWRLVAWHMASEN